MSFYKEVPGRKTTLESALKFDTEPKAGSTNPVTSDGVNTAITESVAEAVGAISDVIPEDTSTENPLVNEQGLEDAIAAADLSGTPAEVAAAALCELKYNQDNMAEEFAELDSRISALENAESVNANRTSLSTPSISKKPSVVLDPEVDAAVERAIKETPAAVESDENEPSDVE